MNDIFISLLREAQAGKTDAFLRLMGSYTPFALEYFRCRGIGDQTAAINLTQSLFGALWCQRDQVRSARMLDQLFLRELQAAVDRAAWQAPQVISGPVVPPFPFPVSLSADEILVLVGLEMEMWPSARLAAGLGLGRASVDEELLRLRSRLLGIELGGLKLWQRHRLRKVSLHLLEGASVRKHRWLCRASSACETIHRFKAEWVEFRSQLIEWRQDLRLSPGDEQLLTEGVLSLIEGHEAGLFHLAKPRSVPAREALAG